MVRAVGRILVGTAPTRCQLYLSLSARCCTSLELFPKHFLTVFTVMSSVQNLSDQDFSAAVLESEGLVLVDFWAPWCGPCRLIAPLMDWAAETYGDRVKVAKMEVDPNPETISQYKIEGIPTLILFRDGEIIDRLEGAVGKPKIEAMLAPHL